MKRLHQYALLSTFGLTLATMACGPFSNGGDGSSPPGSSAGGIGGTGIGGTTGTLSGSTGADCGCSTSPQQPNGATTPPGQTSFDILTQHNDNARTGAVLNENTLTVANVSGGNFGKLYSIPVQGDVYAQVLYLDAFSIGGKTRNVLIVATEHNSVYAIDADAPTSTPIWQVNLGPSVPMSDFPGETNFSTEIGITSTPVIERAAGIVYIVNATKDSAGVYHHVLHRMDLQTGTETQGSPVTVTATAPGTGYASQNGMVSLISKTNLQRTSLLLTNHQIYFGFSAHGITSAYHGWFLSYDANTLQQTGVFTSSPNSAASGIWQGGQGAAADGNGNVYVTSSNGSGSNAAEERVESLLHFVQNANGMNLTDWFTPSNWATLDQLDEDFGSTGVVLVPGTTMAVSGNKAGTLFFSNVSNLGHLQSADINEYAEFNMGTNTAFFSAPVYYNDRVYAWSQNDVLKSYDVSTTQVKQVDEATTTQPIYMPGGVLSISANGTTTGSAIIWATVAQNGTASGVVRPGQMFAFDATDLSRQLYSTATDPNDSPGNFGKFNPPTIARGKVYLGTFSNQVVVYGLR